MKEIKLTDKEKECIRSKFYHWVQHINKKKENTTPRDYDYALIDLTLKFINKRK